MFSGGKKSHRRKFKGRPGGARDTYEAGAEPVFDEDTGGSDDGAEPVFDEDTGGSDDTNECDWEVLFGAGTGGSGGLG